MNLEPLLTAPLQIQVHLLTVLPAFALGTWLLWLSSKGSQTHRVFGRLYLGLMSVTAVSATFIKAYMAPSVAIGPLRFGPLHLLVLLTGWSIWTAVTSARRGDIAAHRGTMRRLYFGGLIVAGVLALAPGRVLHRMFLD